MAVLKCEKMHSAGFHLRTQTEVWSLGRHK
jgi:hypothetical protein